MADSPVVSAIDNSRLCDCCTFVIGVRCDKEYYPHHQSEAALEKSACDCPLCFNLWLAYSEKKHNHSASAGMTCVRFKFRLLDGSRELDLLKGRSARNIKFHFRAVFSNQSASHNAEQGIAGDGSEEMPLVDIIAAPLKAKDQSILRASSSNTNSKETWSVVSKWLHHCTFRHLECRQEGVSGWMPTRVIDVGTPRSPHLRLQITNANFLMSPYAAVSHCWGGVQSVKQLQEANLLSMVRGIDPNELSPTFRDAITIARRIRLQYLWIDSLCIIQDSLEDWKRESSKMREVYKNCLVNISATAAPNGDTGCFLARNPARARTCRVVIERAATGKRTAKSRAFDLVSRKLWIDSIYRAPLTGRGWVVQEQFLAPRIVHFSRYQVFWECQQLNACEMFPNGITDSIKGSWRKYLLPDEHRNRLILNLVKAETEVVSKRKIDAYSAWMVTISLCSRCHLTKEEDKLIAVSAIAREIQPIIQDKYLAGLWRRYLPFQLLWFTRHPPAGDRIPTRYKQYCAPSWSWASLNANIEPNLETVKEGKDFMIKILEARVETTDSGMFGQVSAGFLRIRGWIRAFYVGLRTCFPWTLDVPGGCLVTAFFDEPQKAKSGLWYCLPILEGLDNRRNLKVTGMILEKAELNNRYRRAGIFHASRRYPEDKRYYDFIRPYFSSHPCKTKGRASGTSENARCKRRKSNKEAEVGGRNITSPLPIFKWDTAGTNLSLREASSVNDLEVNKDAEDWFFFPDSHPKQDQPPAKSILQSATDVGETSSGLFREKEDGPAKVHQTPALIKEIFHAADQSCDNSVPKSSSGRDILSAESNGGKRSSKRQREMDEPDDIHLSGNKYSDSRHDEGSSSVSDQEFSDDSDDETDDEAIEDLNPEDQETRMRKEWVECIIDII